MPAPPLLGQMVTLKALVFDPAMKPPGLEDAQAITSPDLFVLSYFAWFGSAVGSVLWAFATG